MTARIRKGATRSNEAYRRRELRPQIVAVNTVAKATQPTNGNPALAAVRSTGLAACTKAALLATMVAAATVLAPKLRCLKNSRLQPPIMKTFQPSSASARARCALGAALNRR